MFDYCKIFIALIFAVQFTVKTNGQVTTGSVIVDSINILGVQKTKRWIILRELHVRQGDIISYDNIHSTISQIKNDLSRLALFAAVKVSYVLEYNERYSIKITIWLDENWYIYPSVVFEIADRNYDVWAREFNYSLKRTNVGFRVFHANALGYRDDAKLLLHGGYTRKLEAHYNRPFLSKVTNFGGAIVFFYAEAKELAVETAGDKLNFYQDQDEIQIKRLEGRLNIYYRAHLRWFHELGLSVRKFRLRPKTASIFPDFFLNGETIQQGFGLYVKSQFNSLNHPVRPTEGKKYWVSMTADLLGNSRLHYYGNLNAHISFAKLFSRRLSILTTFDGRMSLDRRIRPYNLYQALGYNSYTVTGYSLYVVDGIDMLLTKSVFRYELVEYKRKLFARIFNGGITLKAVLDGIANADAGYVNSPYFRHKKQNVLPNQLLFGGSIGAALTINDVFQLEGIYQVNKTGQHGFFIQTKTAF